MMLTALLAIALSQTGIQTGIQPGIRISDEGTARGQVIALDCVGPGVVCTKNGITGTITVTGGSGGSGGGLPADPAACPANQFVVDQNASGVLTCAALTDSAVPDTITVNNAATAGTAAALASDPADCSANQFAHTIAANGNLTCSALADADVPDNITVDLAATATSLATDPADCSANEYAHTIGANGALTCSQPGFSNLSGSASIAQGGTTETASTEDAVLVGAGTTDWQPKVLPSCSNATTSKLLYDSSTNTFSCGADQTGGAGSGNFIEVSLSFGTGDVGVYTTTVTGQAWVTASSRIVCQPQATSADGQTVETYYAAQFSETVANRVAGVGFDLAVYNPLGATGTFRFNCIGG